MFYTVPEKGQSKRTLGMWLNIVAAFSYFLMVYILLVYIPVSLLFDTPIGSFVFALVIFSICVDQLKKELKDFYPRQISKFGSISFEILFLRSIITVFIIIVV